MILGVGVKIFGGNIRSQNYAFSDIFGPDLTPRVVTLCMGIAICHRQTFGQVSQYNIGFQPTNIVISNSDMLLLHRAVCMQNIMHILCTKHVSNKEVRQAILSKFE